MALPLVHHLVRTADRPGGGSSWICPFCRHQVVAWLIYRKVTVKGQSDGALELTQADDNWLTVNCIAWS